MIKFALQCCDARRYLILGKACALKDLCYDDLRPQGIIYWFSLPYRLGLDASAIIWGHLLLMLISIITGSIAALSLINKSRPEGLPVLTILLMIAGITLAHVVFLHPVLKHSLSDAPASLLFLIGLWLFIIYHQKKTSVILIALAGLCLGLSAWMRIFFLYPVIIFIGIRTATSVFSSTKHACRELGILSGLIPILFQFMTTWTATGEVAFIESKTSDGVRKIHTVTHATGYDTVLQPTNKVYVKIWKSQCGNYRPLSEALQAYDIRSVSCIVSGRINFYLGSYSPVTYYKKQFIQEEIIDHSLLSDVFIFYDKSHPVRLWSGALLIAHVAILLITLLFLLNLYKNDRHLALSLSLIFSLIAGMCIVIIPEQRFAIAPMILIWFFFLVWLAILYSPKPAIKATYHDRHRPVAPRVHRQRIEPRLPRPESTPPV